jgi:hypothetical protein
LQRECKEKQNAEEIAMMCDDMLPTYVAATMPHPLLSTRSIALAFAVAVAITVFGPMIGVGAVIAVGATVVIGLTIAVVAVLALIVTTVISGRKQFLRRIAFPLPLFCRRLTSTFDVSPPLVEVMFLAVKGADADTDAACMQRLIEETRKIAHMFTLCAVAKNTKVMGVVDEAAHKAPLDRCLTVRVYANQSGKGCRLQRIPDVDPRRDVNVELSQGTGSNIVAPDRIITYHYEKGAIEGPETEQCFATLLALARSIDSSRNVLGHR